MSAFSWSYIYIDFFFLNTLSGGKSCSVAPGVAVPPWATETVISPWMAADEARVSHVLPHVVWWKKNTLLSADRSCLSTPVKSIRCGFVVVGVLTCSVLLHSACDLKAAQMNVWRSLIRELFFKSSNWAKMLTMQPKKFVQRKVKEQLIKVP